MPRPTYVVLSQSFCAGKVLDTSRRKGLGVRREETTTMIIVLPLVHSDDRAVSFGVFPHLFQFGALN